jgi:trans-2,3-dihydro-3-hydroxyanthranilate isomerase
MKEKIMPDIIIKQVDVFTTTPFAGNPAGVVTEAEALSSETMQAIAAEMSLAETTFVTLPSIEEALFRVRFFSQSEEFDLSGHALIASCFALIEDGRIPLADGVTKALFETRAGLTQVDIHYMQGVPAGSSRLGVENGVIISIDGRPAGILEKIMIHQTVKQYRPSTISASEIAKYCAIESSEITRTGLPLEIISTGLEQLIIPVLHKETIRDMNPDLIKLGIMNRRYGIHTNHLFSLDVFTSDCTAYLRHFAPALGMWEDPASGTAAAGLTSYLLRHGVLTTGNLIVEQGKDVENLARIIVEGANPDDPMAEMRVGGLAVTSITRRIGITENEIVVQ